jgi:hypothetical protein
MDIHKDTKPLRLFYFYLGVIATFAYRIIIVLNFFEPAYVEKGSRLQSSHFHLRTNIQQNKNSYICRSSYLERETGVEPATFSLARRRSTTEPFPRNL